VAARASVDALTVPDTVPAVNDLLLNLSNGTRIYSPASLSSITTYVLLEQETWFEKEFGFVDTLLQPGMHAIDIGANLGTFAMAMAKAVGPAGRVTAYEPTSSTRASLTRTREANEAVQVEIVGKALSDGERMGRIVFASSSELNHLGEAGEGEGEAVEISSLDAEAAREGWPIPYFIKIDAEGEEIAILRGGRKLLAEASPVLMLELKVGDSVNDGLIEAAGALGFLPYQLLDAAGILVPFDPSTADAMQLDFFAIDDRRAGELEQRGLLVRTAAEINISESEIAAGVDLLRRQSFARSFPVQFSPQQPVHPDYAFALAGYAIWRDGSKPAATRLAALRAAYERLKTLCEVDGRMARISTLARIAYDVGEVVHARALCQLLLESAEGGRVALGEPFWPAHPRFDRVAVAERPAQWFLAAASEQAERLHAFSTAFAPPTRTLAWLCSSGFGSLEMLRRRALSALRGGSLNLPETLIRDAPDHLNAALWRDGTVAGLAPDKG
jgi:FkbM family methyltransferase